MIIINLSKNKMVIKNISIPVLENENIFTDITKLNKKDTIAIPSDLKNNLIDNNIISYKFDTRKRYHHLNIKKKNLDNNFFEDKINRFKFKNIVVVYKQIEEMLKETNIIWIE